MQDSPGMNWAHSLWRVILEKGRGKGRPYCSLQSPERRPQSGGAGLFQVMSSKTRGNGLMLHEERFKLSSRKIFFTESPVKSWNWLPKEAAESLHLEVFKTHVDGTQGHGLVVAMLGWWLDPIMLQVFSNTNHSMMLNPEKTRGQTHWRLHHKSHQLTVNLGCTGRCFLRNSQKNPSSHCHQWMYSHILH